MAETVRIERAVYGGAGLAHRASGAVAFVPFVLPEELAEIDAPSGANEAVLQRVMEPAPTRIDPPCPHFGRCGGCQYQHAEYAAQVEIKRDILRETMQRAGVDALPEIASHMGEPWGYRNRVRFRLGKVEGAFRVGYSVRGTNAFLPITQCPIAAPLLWKAAAALLQLSEDNSEAKLWLEAANEVEFFCNADLSRLQMTLLCTRAKPAKKNSFARLCEALQQGVPELSGAGVLTGDARGANTNFTESWGTAGLAYRVADENYWVSRGGFFQVNRFLVEELLPLVCDGRSGDIAWDLYAGVGLFSRVLARSFAQVTAVEANPSAANDLRISLGKLGSQHRSVQASTLEFLRGAVVQRERPALIVLDPPRAGAGLEACELLLKIAAPAVVYVSCDPTTLARDLVVLQRDYRIAAMHLVDLFPQTFHLETVVMLARR
ncbi:23S rRNA (uracil(1939)-C(5))-methyltransferase RlmD [Granulicella mallensis]|uniref:23S rRNA (Uracil1939-C5)-methyltransferase n=1 Tax=Granulicella mallensis TaxID=940614 RepID=A0A7W7ZQ71_9BACT|nr:23S rRNA (uracil(1939)-C(5))-methyltransferase RlmD [Granulicella mallensis]MBB5063251.1 23S rRNA (uracil1939-C5)-methyltransferase [Granulicella mallensis]